MQRSGRSHRTAAGLDILADDVSPLQGKRVALLVNHTSVTSQLEYSWDILTARGIEIKKIFSPEHGLFGTEQDQDPCSEQDGTGIPVISLYGSTIDSLTPHKDDLDNIDVLIYDIQDVGSRYYTYLNTMIYCMKRLSGTGTELMVLDRPNPLNGINAEGPRLKKGYESFVGVAPVPVRHAMTAGEMALYARDVFGYDLELTIIKMKGWERKCIFSDTGLPWVPPSPNMPTLSTALVYPGMCLLEGTNISEGRGSTTPFELFGAPFLNADAVIEEFQKSSLEGCVLRKQFFKPTFNKFALTPCPGIYIHVTDLKRFRPFFFGVKLVEIMKRLHGEFAFTDDVYEFNDIHPAFDLLTGGCEIREALEAGDNFTNESPWKTEEKEFLKERESFLLYHDN